MRRVGPIEDGDSALIPSLHHYVAAGNRDQRAVVGDAILVASLGSGKLVVNLELHGRDRYREDRVGAPLAGISRATLGLHSSTPLVGEENLAAVVVERRGMPVREIGIRRGVEAHRMRRITDVEKEPVPAAGAACSADRRV